MHHGFTNSERIKYAKMAISVSLLALFFISRKLWLNERNYPLAPVFDFFPLLHSPFDYVQLAVPVLLLVLIAFLRKPSAYILVFFVCFWLLVLGDQNRLQPYCFMFAFMLLAIGIQKNQESILTEKITLDSLRLIVIGTYLWAAIHKINIHFVDRFYPFITGYGHATIAHGFFERYLVLVVPLTEFLIAVGLLVKRTRKLALFLAIVMHLSVMALLSPLGLGWNYVVFPWNMGLILVDIFLFWKADDINLRELWSPQRSMLKTLILVVFFILPVFNLFGFWDHYVSSSLYSFKAPYARIYVDETLKKELPQYLTPYYHKSGKGEYIETVYWTARELNVMPYPEKRVYNTVKDFICSFDTRDSCHAALELYY